MVIKVIPRRLGSGGATGHFKLTGRHPLQLWGHEAVVHGLIGLRVIWFGGCAARSRLGCNLPTREKTDNHTNPQFFVFPAINGNDKPCVQSALLPSRARCIGKNFYYYNTYNRGPPKTIRVLIGCGKTSVIFSAVGSF